MQEEDEDEEAGLAGLEEVESTVASPEAEWVWPAAALTEEETAAEALAFDEAEAVEEDE